MFVCIACFCGFVLEEFSNHEGIVRWGEMQMGLLEEIRQMLWRQQNTTQHNIVIVGGTTMALLYATQKT